MMDLNRESLEVIRNNYSIRCLEVHHVDTQIDEHAFADVLSDFESLDLSGENKSISIRQMKALFQKIVQKTGKRKKMKRLSISNHDLSYIDCSLLVKCYTLMVIY